MTHSNNAVIVATVPRRRVFGFRFIVVFLFFRVHFRSLRLLLVFFFGVVAASFTFAAGVDRDHAVPQVAKQRDDFAATEVVVLLGQVVSVIGCGATPGGPAGGMVGLGRCGRARVWVESVERG